MSGHNKWSKIKHKKAASDAQKSREFGKVVRLIKVAAKKSGGNVESPELKAAVDRAKAVNMPKDNIERAIKAAATDPESNMELAVYETYGPGGVAIVIEALTDNTNRTSAEIKHILSKRGFALASPGSASWAFINDHGSWKPTTVIEISDTDIEQLDSLVETLKDQDDVQDVYVNAE